MLMFKTFDTLQKHRFVSKQVKSSATVGTIYFDAMLSLLANAVEI